MYLERGLTLHPFGRGVHPECSLLFRTPLKDLVVPPTLHVPFLALLTSWLCLVTLQAFLFAGGATCKQTLIEELGKVG